MSATLFVDESGVSYVEFEGPNASMGESGGPLGSLERLISDAELQAFVREKFGEDRLRDAIAEARRLLGR